jgi:hypothetical protein
VADISSKIFTLRNEWLVSLDGDSLVGLIGCVLGWLNYAEGLDII